jgi:hypothetical protein
VGALVARPSLAQQRDNAVATVSGIVYDSIARHTIAGASVEFVNARDPSSRPFIATSDASGRYSVAGLPLGTYLAAFAHPALDTLGLEMPPRSVDVNGSTERINFATPSARTVIDGVCPAGAASDSTGLLIGHVRATEEQNPIDGATVLVEWGETVIDALGLRARNQQVTARSAEPGWFAICGLPSDAELQARAFTQRDSSGFVEIEVPAHGLRHVTFFVGGANLVIVPSDSIGGAGAEPPTAWRGRARLSGTVTDRNGKPVANAHAVVWGTRLDATTNDRGMFALSDLPGGTQTVEVRVVGFVPVTTTVHLAESRPASADIVLGERTQVLSTVEIRGKMVYARNLVDFERRRRTGFGQFRTPDEIARRGRNTKLALLLQDFQSLRVDVQQGETLVTMQRNATTVASLAGIRANCIPSLYVDGVLDRTSDYGRYYSGEIAGIEVYREHDRPMEFINPENACGSVAIWTREIPKIRKD